jgi:hypothetical protein
MADKLGNQIIASVEKRGWYVIHVLPSPDGSDGDEICSYTIGLPKTLKWPELICFGRAPDEAEEMLRLTIAECWERQVVPHEGLMLNKVVRNSPVKLARNDGVLKNYLGLADWYAAEVDLSKPERLQLLWPDSEGLLPDDPRCQAEVRNVQPPRLSA